jgi:hypothetical protein
MDHSVPFDANPPIARESGSAASVLSAEDLAWAALKMQAGERIIVNKPLMRHIRRHPLLTVAVR